MTWLPVTQFGDRDQHLGFRRRGGYDDAVDLDASEWDDPDYLVAAFVGRDRPFTRRECDTEPGESASRLRGLRSVDRLRERVEDLEEPVEEITSFDECLFTVGMRVGRGYHFKRRDGRRVRRAAFAFDMRGDKPAQLDIMAFPDEEPPQIECNEDGSDGTRTRDLRRDRPAL